MYPNPKGETILPTAPAPSIAIQNVLIFGDRNLTVTERKTLKKKMGSIEIFDSEIFMNRSIEDICTQHEANSIFFNMKDLKAREWVSRNIELIKTHINFCLVESRKHDFISFIDADIVCKWKRLEKLEFRISELGCQEIEEIPLPKSQISRFLATILSCIAKKFNS